jgi:hypothetical protein
VGENKRLVNGPLFDTYLNEQKQNFSNNNNNNANNLKANEIERDDYHKLVNVNLNDQQYRNEIYRNSHLIMSKQNLIVNQSNYYGASFSLSSQIKKQQNNDDNQTNYLSNQCPFLDDTNKVNNNFSTYEAKPIQLNSNTKQSPFFMSNNSADSQKDNNNATSGHQQISCV